MADSFTLHERTVTIGGYEYDDGPLRVIVGRRTFRIREFTDEQIQSRMMLAFAVGATLFAIPLFWTINTAVNAEFRAALCEVR